MTRLVGAPTRLAPEPVRSLPHEVPEFVVDWQVAEREDTLAEPPGGGPGR